MPHSARDWLQLDGSPPNGDSTRTIGNMTNKRVFLVASLLGRDFSVKPGAMLLASWSCSKMHTGPLPPMNNLVL